MRELAHTFFFKFEQVSNWKRPVINEIFLIIDDLFLIIGNPFLIVRNPFPFTI